MPKAIPRVWVVFLESSGLKNGLDIRHLYN
jgi:hypothetical protein